MAMAQSIADIVRQNPSKRGLVLIVTNDYKAAPKLKNLHGPIRDGDRMQRVFNQLQITTIRKHNIIASKLIEVLTEIARLAPLPTTYRSISFIFSGHGNEKEEVYLQDGRAVRIQEIVNALLPTQAPNIGSIPKLFFIDACRGSNTLQPILVPRSAVPAGDPQGVCERGGKDVQTLLVPPDGNILVAYSVSPGYKALEGEDGGIWMNALALKLVESQENIDTVLTEVRRYLHENYQDPKWKDHWQMPMNISTLLNVVHLNPQTDPHKPHVKHTPTAPPGKISVGACVYVCV